MAPEHLIGAAVLSPAKGRQGLSISGIMPARGIAVHEHPSMVDWRPNHSRRAPRGISAVRPQVLFSMSDCHRIGSDYLYCSNCLCELQAFLVSFLKQIVNEFNILVYKAQQSICIPRQIAFQGSPHSLSISQPCYKTCRNLKIADKKRTAEFSVVLLKRKGCVQQASTAETNSGRGNQPAGTFPAGVCTKPPWGKRESGRPQKETASDPAFPRWFPTQARPEATSIFIRHSPGISSTRRPSAKGPIAARHHR